MVRCWTGIHPGIKYYEFALSVRLTCSWATMCIRSFLLFVMKKKGVCVYRSIPPAADQEQPRTGFCQPAVSMYSSSHHCQKYLNPASQWWRNPALDRYPRKSTPVSVERSSWPYCDINFSFHIWKLRCTSHWYTDRLILSRNTIHVDACSADSR